MDLFDDIDALRAFFPDTTAGNALLIALAEAAEVQITALVGPLGDVVEVIPGYDSRVIILSRPAASITKITERQGGTSLELAADDYRLNSDHRSLWRLYSGTNPAYRWQRWVEVEFPAVDDLALRRAVAVALIKADLTAQPGVLMLTEGNFSIQFANGQTYTVTRDDVLGSLGASWNFA